MSESYNAGYTSILFIIYYNACRVFLNGHLMVSALSRVFLTLPIRITPPHLLESHNNSANLDTVNINCRVAGILSKPFVSAFFFAWLEVCALDNHNHETTPSKHCFVLSKAFILVSSCACSVLIFVLLSSLEMKGNTSCR